MTLDPRTALLSHDHTVDKYTALCGLGDPGYSASSLDNTDANSSNPQRPTDAQGQLRGKRELQNTEPTSFSSKLKRGRGRPPKSDQNLKKTRRRKVPAAIAPKLQASSEILPKPNSHGLLSPGIYSSYEPTPRSELPLTLAKQPPKSSRNRFHPS